MSEITLTNVLHDIYDERLTVDKYISCVCNNDYSVLAIDESATAEQISYAWLHICSKIMEVKNDPQAKHYLEMRRKVVGFDIKEQNVMRNLGWVKKLRELLPHLTKPEHLEEFTKDAEYFANEIKLDGYNFHFTADSYQSDIQRVINKLANEKTKIDFIRKRIDGTADEANANTPVTPMTFYKNITLMQKHLGIASGKYALQISKEMSIGQYFDYMAMTKEQIEQSNGTAGH